MQKPFIFTPDCAGLKSVLDGEYDIELKEAPFLILDIGANQGAFSYWARQKWPSARIMAYEPMPENVAVFRQNHGDDAQVEIRAVAISTAGSYLRMHYGRNNLGECSAYDVGEQTGQVLNVPAISPRVLPAADFIKIDTEGCEVEILKNLDLTRASAVALEYHNDSHVPILVAICERAGLEQVTRSRRCPNRGILTFRLASAAPERRPRKLFIGLPVAQKIDVQFMECLTGLQKEKPCEFEVHYKQGDGIARSRNVLTAKFLKSDCTDLLFIDCDLIFSGQQIARLLAHDAEVVAGFYPKKQEGPLEWVVNTLPDNPAPDAAGLQRVRYAGTGFLMISRKVFEKMIAAYPEIAYREDYGQKEIAHDFWAMAPYGPNSAESILRRVRALLEESDKFGARAISIAKLNDAVNFNGGENRYLSEDWFFCQRWLDLGNEVLMDTHVILRHIGTAIYPLQSQLGEINQPAKRAAI